MDLPSVKKFVEENKYQILSGTEHESRCIDGRYHSPSYLPPLARPGADAGELLTILATLRILEAFLPQENVVELLLRIIGGEKNFNFHTDDHSLPGFLGCGHLKMIKLHHEQYALTVDEVDFVLNTLEKLKRRKANLAVLRGGHNEQTVIEVVSQKFSLKNIQMAGQEMRQAFVYHKTLDEMRREKIAASLWPSVQSRVKETELKEAYGKMAQRHLLKTISYLASGLPTYEANIADNGEFTVSEKVESGVLADLI